MERSGITSVSENDRRAWSLYGKPTSRRTETAYKAKSLDESAQHDEVQDSRRYGKCCGCVEKDHSITTLMGVLVRVRGGLFDFAAVGITGSERTGISRGHSKCRNTSLTE